MDVTFLSVLCGRHKYMATYVKEVISTLQNVNFEPKISLKMKKISCFLAPAVGYEVITNIK